jgi:hypothetical protein
MARTVQTNVEDACRKMLDQAEVRLRGAVVFSTQLKRGVAGQQPSACHVIKLSTSSSPTESGLLPTSRGRFYSYKPLHVALETIVQYLLHVQEMTV